MFLDNSLICADLHIGVRNYGYILENGFHTREIDFFKSFSNVIKHGEDCNKLFILGDIFNKSNPSTRLRKLFYKILNRFDGEIWIIIGNHDYDSYSNCFSDIKELKLEKKIHIVDDILNPHKSTVLVPFNKEYNYKKSEYVLTHKGVSEILSGYTKQDLKSDNSIKDFKGCKLVLSGHIHEHIQMNNFEYVGSLDRITFKECDEVKYFCKVYDGQFEYYSNDTTRKMVVLKDDYEKCKNDLSESIVRFKLHEYNAGKIKKFVEEKGIFFFAGVELYDVKKKVEEIKQVENINIDGFIKEYIKKSDFKRKKLALRYFDILNDKIKEN